MVARFVGPRMRGFVMGIWFLATGISQYLGSYVANFASVPENVTDPVLTLPLYVNLLLGLGVVPLTSAYATCEAFGWETGVDWNWREAPAFYSLLAFFIGFAALFVMIPGLPLLQVMFLAQVLNALLLPFILVFMLLLINKEKLMGEWRNGRIFNLVAWGLSWVNVRAIVREVGPGELGAMRYLIAVHIPIILVAAAVPLLDWPLLLQPAQLKTRSV